MFKFFLKKVSMCLPLITVLVLILFLSFTTKHTDLIGISSVVDRSYVNGDFDFYKNIFGSDKAVSSPIAYSVDLLFYSFLKKTHLINFSVYNFSSDNFFELNLINVGFLKLKYFLAFIVCSLFLYKISKQYDKSKYSNILLLFVMSPVLIFFPFTQGNNDIYPVMFTLISLFFSFKGKNYLSVFFITLSALTKNYALFLFLPIILVLSEKKKSLIIKYFLLCFAVIFVTYGLYYKDILHFLSAGGEGLFVLQRNILNGPLLFPLTYFLIILFLMFKQEITKDNKNEVLVKYCFAVLSLFYLTSLYIPQWFLWIVPFFALTAYKDRRLFYLYVVICFAFFMGLFSWGRNLDASLFAVAFPFINKISSISELIARYFADFKIFEIFNSLFFAGFIAYLYILFFDKKKDDLTEKEIKWFSLSPLFIYLFICFTYVTGMVLIRNKKNRDWYDLGLVSRNEIIGPVVKSGMFYQTFESPKDRLKGINVYFSTYGKKISSAYELVLYQSDCRTEIRKTDIDVTKIEDNKYKEVIFDEITDSAGKNYCFTVAPKDGEVSTPVTLNYSQKDFYLDGDLSLNDKKTKDDVVFQLIYPIK